MNKQKFAFGKVNYIMMAISVVIVLIGFVLMSGGQSTEEAYDPSIFNVRRIKVAPVISFVGYIFMIFAILYRPKNTSADDSADADANAKKTISQDK
jgi:preprotein translocase subunit SecG